MNKLIEFNVSGGTVVIESQDTASGSVMRGASVAQVAEKVGATLVDALSVIRPVAEATMETCSSLDVLPDSVEVEFGLMFKAGLNAYIAKTSSEATLNVKLVWKPDNGGRRH
ncbi:CU044_2847 family protein [Massilia sp. BSC265]|uniref:CU044_2847 family protein n=1 Tax=Massilia sp. BSC265 TaxID=1549812 RepID=UPI0004E86389|nr:CU044_2847 family protein [Massilia sp. BSC265]KFI05411.1 hypothetical protein JN27_23530 [Massilia sp. BSC265]